MGFQRTPCAKSTGPSTFKTMGWTLSMMRMSLYLDGCVNFYNLWYILFISHVLECPDAAEAGLGLIHQVTSDVYKIHSFFVLLSDCSSRTCPLEIWCDR